MVPLQFDAGPELWFVLLLFVLVSVPLFLGVVAFVNRASDGGDGEELAELRERVEALEAERNEE